MRNRRFKLPDKTIEHGDTRVVKKFLWLPKTINGETFWLIKATWVQRFEQWPLTSSSLMRDWFDECWGSVTLETKTEFIERIKKLESDWFEEMDKKRLAREK